MKKKDFYKKEGNFLVGPFSKKGLPKMGVLQPENGVLQPVEGKKENGGRRKKKRERKKGRP